MLREEQINKSVNLLIRDKIEQNTPIYFKGDIDSLSIYVNFAGNSKHTSLICDYCGELLCNHTYFDIINHYEGLYNIDLIDDKQFVALYLKKDFLSTLLPENKISEQVFEFFESGKSGKSLSAKKTNLKTKALAYEIFNSPYNSSLDKLFIESKALELIHTEFNSYFSQKKDSSRNIIKISSQDKEAIHYAKKILSECLDNPPTITELAKKVAINELKLKTGFKRFFNETPYNISLEYRLQEAKRLLEESELNINEISLHVGYKYVQSFSNAFLKRFGIRPKDIMKTRKYYY